MAETSTVVVSTVLAVSDDRLGVTGCPSGICRWSFSISGAGHSNPTRGASASTTGDGLGAAGSPTSVVSVLVSGSGVWGKGGRSVGTGTGRFLAGAASWSREGLAEGVADGLGLGDALVQGVSEVPGSCDSSMRGATGESAHLVEAAAPQASAGAWVRGACVSPEDLSSSFTVDGRLPDEVLVGEGAGAGLSVSAGVSALFPLPFSLPFSLPFPGLSSALPGVASPPEGAGERAGGEMSSVRPSTAWQTRSVTVPSSPS